MSRMPYFVDSQDARWGHKMGNFKLVDAMYRDGFMCPLSESHHGPDREVLGRQYSITREESDAFALGSQQKARSGDQGRQVRRRNDARTGRDPKGKPIDLDGG
jgi:acetyl-CoA C-acetyltransferase